MPDIEIAGVTYPDVPSIELIDSNGQKISFEPHKNISDKPGIIVPDSGGGTYYASSDGLDGYSSVRVAEASYTQAADTGWQAITLDQDYPIPARTGGDLSEALTIDISELPFRPRLLMLGPNGNTPARNVTQPDATYHRFLVSSTELTDTGVRDTDRGFFTYFIMTQNYAGMSGSNVGLYPDSNWSVLRLLAWGMNATINNMRIKAGSWRWRAIG